MKYYEDQQVHRFEKNPINKGIIKLICNDQTFKRVKQNIVGGPSIVFNRYQEKDITQIEKVKYDPVKQEFYIS